MPKKKSGIEVGIFKIANSLKSKLVKSSADTTQEGYIDPSAVEEADRLIEAICRECPRSIGGLLNEISAKWTKMKIMKESEARKAISQEVFTLAHEIKDISSMCGYTLISYFAESLRDYVSETQLSLDAQRVIIQAHIDAITVAHKKGMKDDGGTSAEELKKIVKIAIDKYS